MKYFTVRFLHRVLGYSLRQLAAMYGVHHKTVWRWVHGLNH
jgi:transposase